MILFNLRCAAGHDFEAWFKDGAAWDQRVPGSICCPLCGDDQVNKAPMAPRIAKGARGDQPPAEPTQAQAEAARQLRELRRKVEENCDYVGPRFAEEARRIHYGESEARDIYGEASSAEANELREEGVAFHQIPWLPRTNS